MKKNGRLPRVLLIEAALALGAVITVALPFVVGTYTPLQPPRWWTPVAGFGVLLLVVLWLLLLFHALVDGWRLVTRLPDFGFDDRRVVVHAAFRIVESLGVLSPVILVFYFGRQFGQSPETPHAPIGIGALFIVIGVMIAMAAVVLLHAAWAVVEGRRRSSHSAV